MKRINQAMSLWTALLAALDAKALLALTFGLLAVAVASAPDVGVARVLGEWGISPRGYAVLLVLCAMLMMNQPHSRLFTAFTLPFVVYLAALVQFAASQGSYAPIAVYAGMYLITLRVAADDSKGRPK